MQITRPTLLLDAAKCKANIQRMMDKVQEHELDFRPHFKTHQSASIAEWLRDAGVTACTVSSVKMAEYFETNGWKDILIAFPVNVLESERISALAQQLGRLQLLVYSVDSFRALAERVSEPIGIKIELDLGSQRSGLQTNQHEEIDMLLNEIDQSSNFQFTGFYSHPGHTYKSRGKSEVISMYDKVIEQLEMLKAGYGHVLGFSITVGDTPGCTIRDDFGPINEISPGNFVFYDAMQVEIGSCSYDDVAVVMACPVVDKNPARRELLIHGGAVHFSKESLTNAEGKTHFGKLANKHGDFWEGVIEDCFLKSISQEHGLVQVSDAVFNEVNIGDVLYIYPAHSCLTANLMGTYQQVQDSDEDLTMMA